MNILEAITRAKQKRDKLQPEFDKLQQELQGLEEEIAHLEKAIPIVQKHLGGLSAGSVRRPRKGKMSRPIACVAIMKEMGGQAHIRDLIPRLFHMGLLPNDSSKMWYKVRNALEQRLDLFIKVKGGLYALVESLPEDKWPEEMSSENGRPHSPSPVRDTAYTILIAAEGKPLHLKDILAKLTELRVIVGGKNPPSNLSAHLSQDRRFRSMGSGLWGLTAFTQVPLPSA